MAVHFPVTAGRENKRILAIFPHPDDIEILCAGTLLRLAQMGFEIHVATMTPGDKGSATLSAEEIAAIRREEARRGAETIGSQSYRCLEFRDVEIVFDNPSRRKVAALLREVNPFLVFTTPPCDYMFDHEITSQLVRDACFNAAMINYRTGLDDRPTWGIPYLYYTDAIEGRDALGRPARITCLVDVSAEIDKKAAALACHASQRSWLKEQHGMDNYIESMREWGRGRGVPVGVEYAEAFSQHRGHPHPQNDLLVEWLGAIPIHPEELSTGYTAHDEGKADYE
ncbi:MAG: PIG-L family deacetylase [Armatimonadota bacterium]|nr:PIG-L family deacetylase [Armatimonadota bacterium]